MELSIDKRAEMVRDAVYDLTYPSEPIQPVRYHPVSVFDTYVIICNEADETYWKASYTQDPQTGKTTLSEQSTWQQVQREWVVKTVADWELKAVWTTAYINNLPDSAFLFIESAAEKDNDNKTTPRSKRHFPYKDSTGAVDLPHLRNAIARIPQSNAPGLTADKKASLQEKARSILSKQSKSIDADEEILAFGSEIKALGDGKIGGYLVRFTDSDKPDLTGDFFTKDTDFDIRSGEKATVYYNHGLDPTLKKRKIGQADLTIQDAGVWAETQLELRDAYEQHIYSMAEAGKLGWSSGTLPNLVEREAVGKAFWIKSWPLGKDASLTPTPAAGLVATQVTTIKSWADAIRGLQVDWTKGVGDTPGTNTKTADSKRNVITSTADLFYKGIRTMANERSDQEVFEEHFDKALASWKVKAIDEPLGAQSEKIDNIAKSVNRLLEAMQGLPRDNKGTPLISESGGSSDPRIKSFGDFLMAIQRKDTKRLATVYGSYKLNDDDPETKDIGGDTGAGGGYLLPTDYASSLLQITPTSSPILSRVQTIPVSTTSGMWPVLDQYITPTAGVGQTALAAGITATEAASGSAGGTLTEVTPGFEALQWRIHKIGGYTQVDNEMMSDSPFAIEALLRALFNVAVSAKHEYYVLRGSGTGTPLGILNSPCIVNATPATNNLFSWVDVGNMQAHLKQIGTQMPVWLWHPSVWPDVITMEVGTAGGAVWTANMQAAQGRQLNGYEFFQSEHLPQANSAGDVILADLFAYLLFRRQEITIAYSEHAGFLSDQATWRFTARADGMPWLRNPITLADPTGSYTVSPFVVHND